MSAQAHITSNDSNTEEEKEFLTVIIAEQRFGIPILQIQDVLGEQSITNIPLAPQEVAGSLNLRGRIVTAIDVRKRLDIKDAGTSQDKTMGVVVEHENELYNLIIDSVGDVLSLKNNNFQNNPATLDPTWQGVSAGIYRLDEELLVILDVPKLLESVHS